jgi:hypothetical protein
MAREAQRSIEVLDPNAPWSACDIPLTEISKVLLKARLPSDWAIPAQSKGIVLETYSWAREAYAPMQKPSHLVAIIIAFLISKALPDIYAPKDWESFIPIATSRVDCQNRLKRIPWVAKTGKKPQHNLNEGVYISMVSCWLMAVYDPSSPLRVNADVHGIAFGDLWNEKHCKPYCSAC